MRHKPGQDSVNVEEMGIDLLSLSAHKMYGQEGIGRALRSRSETAG
jgi:cysteine sulfinate desulfinase/cysteine desulfurase-like protein